MREAAQHRRNDFFFRICMHAANLRDMHEREMVTMEEHLLGWREHERLDLENMPLNQELERRLKENKNKRFESEMSLMEAKAAK